MTDDITAQKISEEGRRARFERWEQLGLGRIKADLQNGGHQVVGGTQAVQDLAWEWVGMKEAEEAAAAKPQKKAEIPKRNAPLVIPETSLNPVRFSRPTVMASLQVLENGFTHALFSRFLHELGSDFPRQVPDESLSLKKRLNSFMGIYDEAPNRLVEGGDTIQDAIVEKAASFVRDDLEFEEDGAPPWYVEQQGFRGLLEMDGFVIAGGKIRATLPNDVGLPAAQDELHLLLTKYNLSVASGHLDQALDAHAKGHWAAANSQIRTFFDALFDGICERIDPKTKSLGSGQPRRTQLAAKGFLSRDLNEWADNGLGFINGLAKRLHPQGSHPGLSDPDDSSFRLHVVLLTARFFLRRFDAWGAP
jgi:hypothetical protein